MAMFRRQKCLVLGGFAIVGSSNALNQIMEIDTDALMDRTKLRPLPAGRMNKSEAYFWAISLLNHNIIS